MPLVLLLLKLVAYITSLVALSSDTEMIQLSRIDGCVAVTYKDTMYDINFTCKYIITFISILQFSASQDIAITSTRDISSSNNKVIHIHV